MTSRGLPGFLRRTRRSDFEESDDEIDDDLNGGESDREDPSNRGTNGTSKTNNHENGNHPDATAATNVVDTSSSSSPLDPLNDDNDDSQKSSSRSSQEHENQQSQPQSQSSDDVSTLGASGITQQMDSFHSLSSRTSDRRVSTYRETQFTKVLSAPVVKLPELRKLGWNGIPVRHCFVLLCTFFRFVSLAPCWMEDEERHSSHHHISLSLSVFDTYSL